MAITGLKRSLFSNTSYFCNLYLVECLRKYKSKSYLNSLMMIIEKDLNLAKKKLDCLRMKMCKGVRLRRVKVEGFARKRQMRESTIPTDLTSKHEVCFMMKSAFKVMDTCLWYLNSGYSRHMTGDRSLFKVFESKKDGNVTFGDGSKSQIKGKGIISLPGLPNIANVFYVECLKVNMLSISQIYDQDFMVIFSKGKCLVMDKSGKKLISGVRTLDNCYGLVPDVDIVCNSVRLPNEDLWHQRMRHASYKHLSIVSKHETVLGIPKLSRISNVMCGPCQLGKQTKTKHPSTQTSATSRPLELLHLDLMGPTRTESLGGKRYIMVVVDDFTRYTWIILLRSKSDAHEHIETLCTRLQNKKNLKIDRIRSNHGKEFENSYIESFCTRSGISQEFSTPITPQQNGVVERKNRVIQEMAKAMLYNKDVA